MARRAQAGPKRRAPRAGKAKATLPSAPVAGGAFRLPRVPKGKPARFHRDPAIDQLFGIVAALTGELSVVTERLATLERVLERRGGLAPDDIERYEMDDAEAARRTQEREALIERTFQVLETAPD